MHSLTHSNLSSLPNPKYNNTGSFYLNFDSIACYETNILNQPLEWRRILDIPLPSRLSTADFKRIHFIGTGSSFWAAKIAEFLRREYVHMDAIAVQSYDFVNSRYFVFTNDIVAVFSHRGTKTFSIKALEVTKEHFGATTGT